ncbi:CHAP domain-containing protein [Nocardia sp. NPDC051570]|uniref:CHAP domain-containing protein n=1 Tax=Nocardia sp. NPDC051570 TaxID=3364324 RepID=UPI0037BDACE6
MTRVRTRYWIIGFLVVALVAGGFAGVRWWQHRSERAIAGERLNAFPALDSSALSLDQSRVVTVLRREYADPGDSRKYAEGTEEAWCADFVSWVLNKAGRPLANPNSGSWRIPGVATLREYLESQGSFVAADAGYLPRVGDVVLYAPTSPFGQHTNFVLAADAGGLTTIGGNERGGIRIHHYERAAVPGIVGFGRL